MFTDFILNNNHWYDGIGTYAIFKKYNCVIYIYIYIYKHFCVVKAMHRMIENCKFIVRE